MHITCHNNLFSSLANRHNHCLHRCCCTIYNKCFIFIIKICTNPYPSIFINIYFTSEFTINRASASNVEYNITCDIWNTYSFDINIEESLCVRAHCDVLNIPQYKVNSNNLKSNKILDFNDNNSITNYLIPFPK